MYIFSSSVNSDYLIPIINCQEKTRKIVLVCTEFRMNCERKDGILMTRERYESLSLATLKDLAKARKMKGFSAMKKAELIEAMLAKDEKEKQEKARAEAKEEVKEEKKEKKEGTDIEQLDSGNTANGILEVLPDGYGFIRCENYLPG